jgi:hypothetical protein
LDVLVGCVWRLVFKLLGFVVLYGGFWFYDHAVTDYTRFWVCRFEAL